MNTPSLIRHTQSYYFISKNFKKLPIKQIVFVPRLEEEKKLGCKNLQGQVRKCLKFFLKSPKKICLATLQISVALLRN